MLKQKEFATCIPLIGHDFETLAVELEQALRQAPDYIEWRRDYFLEDTLEMEEKVFALLTEKLGGRELIYTFRDKKEGGYRQVADTSRLEAVKRCAQSGLRGYIDVELACESAYLSEVKKVIKDSGFALLLSHHDFHKTDAQDEMLEVFGAMEEKGADVLKLAMYCQAPEDLKREMVAAELYSLQSDKPMIVIAMGRLGMISRVAPDYCGGSLTYAAGAGSTAPGQLSLAEILKMREMLGIC